MSSHRTKDKTRVEIPNQVLTDLQRAANRKHITVTAYIALILSEHNEREALVAASKRREP